MMLNIISDEGFQVCDGLIFAEQLLLEVEDLLPVPLSTAFWFHDPLCQAGHGFSPRQRELLTADRRERVSRVDGADGTSAASTASTASMAQTAPMGQTASMAPRVLEGMLVIPLLTAAGEGVDLVIYDVDAAVLRKMSAEWLLGLQRKILQRFSRLRHIYTDPETGLYNQRALGSLLSGESCWKSLFFVATVSGTQTVAGGFQQIRQLASRLRHCIGEPLFYFGQGLFGLVSRHSERSVSLDFSHHLISLLKREGVQRVHVGFSLLTGKLSAEEMLHNCQLILSEAERRGPYSLCDGAFLQKKEQHPFALPPVQILRGLQRRWCGLDQFGMLLIEFSRDGSGNDEVPDLAPMLPAVCSCVSLTAHQRLLLLPEYTAEQLRSEAQRLSREIEHITGLRPAPAPAPAMGYCHWPSSGLSKVDCIRSCHKALLHGSFYGDGAVVEFDSLSFNVSGDLSFDEGDYKQAIREYRAGLSMNPGDVNLLNSLGVALAEISRHNEAVACFSLVLDAAADNYMALMNKGMSCRLLGRDEEAVTCFEQGLRCRDHTEQVSLELYLQLGKLYCMREQFEKAVDLLEEWRKIKGEPGEFVFFRLMGEACMGAGRNREAIKALQRSLQMYPQNADSQSMLGLLYVLEGQGAEVGLSLCDRAVAADSANASHLYRRGRALSHLERFSEALSDARASLKIKRHNEEALLLRGLLYEELGSVRRARQSFQRIVSMKTVAESRKKEALAGLSRISARA